MAKNRKFMTLDGNSAAAYTAYAFTEVAGIYPITPSSPMAEIVDQWAAIGKTNLFGQTVKVVEMQSEGGAAAVIHGALNAGALTTTFTASQGLLLMIPNMYKMAGELLPGVLHVTARAVASHALSIFGDHSDVMACRQTGFALLASNSVQEALDLAAVSHLSAIRGRVPFLHFFDGFRTSHEVQKIESIDYADFDRLLDRKAVQEFRDRALSPNHPVLRGTAQNPDIFFQAREACNPFYEALPAVVEHYMAEIGRITGREYKPFQYVGAPDADRIVVAMGSVCETAEEAVAYLNRKGQKVGLLKVHLYRPFSVERMLAAIPKTVKRIAVLDRTKEPGAQGEPLYLDVCAAYASQCDAPSIVGGRYGLGSKDTTPGQLLAVFANLAAGKPKNGFTIGIVDDVTNLSLPVTEDVDMTAEGTISCKFWGFGSDGTVGANKNSIKIIGDHTDMYAQAYFSYDSKKSGGVSISDLRFGRNPIRSPYLVKKADFLACHKTSYVDTFDMLPDLKKGGTFLLNCPWSGAELDEKLPAKMKRHIAENGIRFYTIDAIGIARELGLGGRINTIMQAAFFQLAKIIPIQEAVGYMKDAIVKSYGKKGDEIVRMNNAAVDAGVEKLVEVAVPAAWKDAADAPKAKRRAPAFIEQVADVMNAMAGDTLPVSAFQGREDGTFPQGTSQYEKRGIAVETPEWQPDKCIQCNQCALVCPHATIRPFLVDAKEAQSAPAAFTLKPGMKPYEQYGFRIQVDVLDCYGCGSCANVCPAKEKALIMKPLETQMEQAANWDYAMTLSAKPNPANKETVKGSQFEAPLLEFSGACAGCGETPYAKLVTQLFGDRMLISNATGCSSIWGASAPATPYRLNEKGQGPAWANSLFEDNAENGLGMHLGAQQIRARIADLLQQAMALDVGDGAKAAFKAWLDAFGDGKTTRAASDAALAAVKAYAGGDGKAKAIFAEIVEKQDYLVKRSTWIFGGDGWAYDIGYGGLDHVLSTGEDVNVLVFDTEVYSNTGGQASKSTPTGSIAQFAAAGKPTRKKDLGLMAMSYGYVYVAQIAMGASQAQTIKAIAEAEAYKGPSLVIAYAPCINHGIKGGMTVSQTQEKRAVECGYWHLYRYNPDLKAEGKNPFQLDSKDPTASFQEFLMSEVRYNSLVRSFPDRAEVLFKNAEEASKDRLANYKRLAATL